jgi:hypothetical protein
MNQIASQLSGEPSQRSFFPFQQDILGPFVAWRDTENYISVESHTTDLASDIRLRKVRYSNLDSSGAAVMDKEFVHFGWNIRLQ